MEYHTIDTVKEESFISSESQAQNSDIETSVGSMVVSEKGEEAIPRKPHEEFLYQLLGQEKAEGFLHPKLVVTTSHGFVSMRDSGVLGDSINLKKPVVFRNERERRQRYKAGRVGGAVGLWRSLRDNSWGQVTQQTTAKEDPEVQKRYNAVAREVLRNQEVSLLSQSMPPQRSFIEDHSVEELARLMRSSRVDAVHARRRKKQLMFQLAEAHVDQFSIMALNRPIPGLTDRQEDTSISRYIPSWDQQHPPTATKDWNQTSRSDSALENDTSLPCLSNSYDNEEIETPLLNNRTQAITEIIDSQNSSNQWERPQSPTLKRPLSTRQAINKLGLE